jgi:2-polyprenyl-3-methyl-5-hydroxy-6-metoxy-1,4-benzoquinol methylase
VTGPARCCACQSTAAAPAYAGLIRCKDCGHTWADIDLPEDQLHRLYGRRYFHGQEYSDYTIERPQLEKNFARRMEVLTGFIDPSRHRRLFELGCAYGFFLNMVRHRFDTVEGVDISEDAVRFAKDDLGLPVVQGDLLRTNLGDRHYDVVCMWDVIEHLQRPDAHLEILSRHIGPGGLIALTTGDISSLNARLKRARWRLIHPPTHVHYFTRRSIARMLARFGFDVVCLQYCGFYRSVGGMLDRVLGLRWGFDRLAAVLQRTPLARQSVYLNLRDIMYVIAVKRAV